MRLPGFVVATAAAAATVFVALVEAQDTSIIRGDGPPAPSLTRTAALGSWTPKASSDGLTKPSLTGMGRTIYINSASDFCLLMPPDPTTQNLVDAEAIATSYCINPINGTRPMPDGLIKTAHFRRTPEYVQISGTYDPAVMNLGSNDCGGEYDSEGAEGVGNPVGVTMRNGSYFSQFMGACDIPGSPVFCLRMCPSYEYCRNTFDLMGCLWTQPGDYDQPQAFTNCDANADLPTGVYNSSYTFSQGMSVTPPPVTAPASSNCKTVASPTASGVTYSWNQVAAASPAASSTSKSNGGSSGSTSGSSSGGGSKSGAASALGPVNVYALGVTVLLGVVAGGALLV
ncbi:macrophage activating glycoprotein [Pseudozyma hubeiensis SY62]|uniref:Macrophage activating glycoprotein n=1 Tax=Pseudozyma hubeiensis (strain SY62) TaxID=1305764 RepID=R9PCU1_PSEHS|nr:macrophage activating glycoprotein [Pseudozyma hubeiensis SY62]GAC99213.1 macrophage activating glycoprotein [Pseudozyma hubeiensis SY62]